MERRVLDVLGLAKGGCIDTSLKYFSLKIVLVGQSLVEIPKLG